MGMVGDGTDNLPIRREGVEDPFAHMVGEAAGDAGRSGERHGVPFGERGYAGGGQHPADGV